MDINKALEKVFSKISESGVRLFSKPLVFLLAFGLTIYWFFVHHWQEMTLTDSIRDIILAITFLSLFIIQRSFNHFSQVLHLKLNELVAAHENARNVVVKSEEKTEEEIKELSKEHDRIIEETKGNKD